MRNKYLLRKYGITDDQYDKLLASQRGCCAVCGRPDGEFKSRLAVDHDHHSGEIRGLLCFRCNRYVVGRYRRENAGILQAALTYLTAEYSGWIVPPKKKRKKRVRIKKKRKLQRAV